LRFVCRFKFHAASYADSNRFRNRGDSRRFAGAFGNRRMNLSVVMRAAMNEGRPFGWLLVNS
jgi:hypothetical protein